MAGIGFELNKILRKKSYINFLRAYGYAGILGSGSWIIAIIGIACIDMLNHYYKRPLLYVNQFEVSVTYLISSTFIFNGIFQYIFTRYVADQVFYKRFENILPNFFSILTLQTIIAGIIVIPLVSYFFKNETFLYQLFFVSTFIVLANIWLTTTLLSGMRSYRAILMSYALGYGTVVILGFLFHHARLSGLMLAFFIGQTVLFSTTIIALFREYHVTKLISFDIFNRKNIYFSLIFISFFYNLGLWSDKYVFWMTAETSHSVIGPLRSSVIYDLPMFLALITMIPGIAIFIFRIETDFVKYYNYYHDSIRDGSTFSEIQVNTYLLIDAARYGLYDIVKVQGIFIFTLFLTAPEVISKLGISKFHIYLFKIDLISAGLLVLLMSIINVILYFDRRFQALFLCVILFTANTLLTIISIRLGAYYYGYGFATALLLTTIIAMIMLDYNFRNLNYLTLMRV